MSDKLLDHVQRYADYRQSLSRYAGTLFIVCVILVAIARSPDFKFEAPALVDGTFHNGYVMAYGHFLILVLAFKYFSDLNHCLNLRRSILSDRSKAESEETSETIQFLLLPPFLPPFKPWNVRCCTIPPKLESWRRWVHCYVFPVMPALMVLAAYTAFIVLYFSFSRAEETSSYLSLLFGFGPKGIDLHGFHADWSPKRTDGQVWINAPLQTWIGLAGEVYLLYAFVQNCRVMNAINKAMERSKPSGDSDQTGKRLIHITR